MFPLRGRFFSARLRDYMPPFSTFSLTLFQVYQYLLKSAKDVSRVQSNRNNVSQATYYIGFGRRTRGRPKIHRPGGHRPAAPSAGRKATGRSWPGLCLDQRILPVDRAKICVGARTVAAASFAARHLDRVSMGAARQGLDAGRRALALVCISLIARWQRRVYD